MKEITGLWVYRAAFACAIGICVLYLGVIMTARSVWYPSYEEKILAGMKKMEDAFQLPVKSKEDKKTKVSQKTARRLKAKMRAKKKVGEGR